MMFGFAANAGMAVIDAALLLAIWKKPGLVTLHRLVAVVVLAPLILVPILFLVGLFAFLRLAAWAIFVHLVIVLAGEAILLWKTHRKTAIASAAVSLLIAIVGIDAFFIEPHWLDVTHVRLTSPKIKRPIRIAIVADIQTDHIGEYERKALCRVAEERPDLVLYAGDYIQIHDEERRTVQIQKLRQAIQDARIGAPAVAVVGDCDYADWTAIFEGLDVTADSNTTTVQKGEVQVTALSLMDSEYGDTPVPPSDRFHIVVGHRPDFAMNDAIQADLLVAGHTHGGQVRLPLIGPLITLSRVPRSWAAGVTNLSGGRTLIVARGIGMERGPAPRLRFLCRPELVIVDVVPSP